jgi:pyruvate/2-oxoglutarate dehydrogenase complex dihydrolipoamide acyltransferase (E2) component
MGTSEPVPLVVPQMGLVEQVLLIEWLVEEGAAVAAGDEVVIVETDKVETELVAPVSGSIRIIVQPGDDEIPVGTVLAEIHPI